MCFILMLIFVSDPIAARIGHWPESVDLIELNHKHDRTGKHTFSQVIFWERHPGNGKYRVRDWFLVDDRESLSGYPVKRNDRWESWFVKEGKTHRITSPIFKESWTMYDPEVEDKRKWPGDARKKLRNPELIIDDSK